MRTHWSNVLALTLGCVVLSGCIHRAFQERESHSKTKWALSPYEDAQRRDLMEEAMAKYGVLMADQDALPEMFQIDEPPGLTNLVELQPLPLKPLPGRPAHSSADLDQIPEGMTVFGKLSRDRPTVIQIHGWSRGGNAVNFYYADRWHKAGWNTVTLRWHQHSFDPGLIPSVAERRIWAGDGEFGVQEYKRLLAVLGPNYKHPIRFVSHSLGVSMASYIVASMLSVDAPLHELPRRFDILDPYVGFWRTFPQESPLAQALGQPRTVGDGLQKVMDLIRYRTNIATTFHAGFIGRMTSSSIWGNIWTQLYDFHWLGGNPDQAHWQLHVGYLRSISLPPPRVVSSDPSIFALSAATPDDQLRGRYPRYLRQTNGMDKLNASDMEFVDELNAPGSGGSITP